jgi:beta-lactamase class A
MKLRQLIRTVALFAVLTAPAMAGDAEIAAIEATLRPGPVDSNLFAPEFLRAVPPAQLQATLDQITAQVGPVLAVEPRGGTSYSVETATHRMPTEITLDAAGRIVGLLFQPAVAKALSAEQVLANMAAIAPQFGLLVTRDGAPLHAVASDTPLSVGSAFKLGVLKALRDEIDAGRHDWSDVVQLAEANKSLPSGTLQTWPVGSPLTLHTLAALMISISDNTATDALIHTLGRERVETVLGIAPVLTTRELFTLKAEPELRARYLSGNLAEQRRVLTELAELPLPDVATAMSLYDPGMEWNLTATALCGLIDTVADLDVMAINPGVANRSDWDRVAFKGGSETGVLNLTTTVQAEDGTRYCIAATWNGPQAIDQTAATTAYASLLALLARS